MTVTDDLDEAIEDAAAGPASMSTGAGSVTAHGLPDLIEADRYLAAKRQRAKGMGSVIKNVFAKLVPPGGA